MKVSKIEWLKEAEIHRSQQQNWNLNAHFIRALMYILKIYRLTYISLFWNVSITGEEYIYKMCALELFLFNTFIFINLVFWDYLSKTPFSLACSLTIEIVNILHLSSLPKQPGLISGLIFSCNRIKTLETTSLSWLEVSTGRSRPFMSILLEGVIHLNFHDTRFSWIQLDEKKSELGTYSKCKPEARSF